MKELLNKIQSNDGFFHNGDPATGQQGTRVTAEWLNDVQNTTRDMGEELHYVLAKAGAKPISTKKTQVYDAMIAIINAHRNSASQTQRGEVLLTDAVSNNSSLVAGSGKAVKTAYDKAVEGVDQAIKAQVRADEAYANAEKRILHSQKSDAINRTSSDTVATSKAVKTAYDKGAEALRLAQTKQAPATTLEGYGISDFQVRTFKGDLNELRSDGIFYTEVGSQHLPPEMRSGQVVVVTGGAGNQGGRQIFKALQSGKTFERWQLAGAGNRWSEWKRTDGDSIPLGTVVGFPKAIRQPLGFLKCDGTVFNKAVYPELYQLLGNSDRLPDLNGGDIGQVAFFPSNELPQGWIAFDEIAHLVTAQAYPELFAYLTQHYGTIDQVPKLVDRFIRNAGGGLAVGTVQGDAIRNIQGEFLVDINSITNPPNGAFKGGSSRKPGYGYRDGGDPYSMQFNASLVVPTADENRPKAMALKCAIKATSTLSDVVFWIRSHGDITTPSGRFNPEGLSQDLQGVKANMSTLQTTLQTALAGKMDVHSLPTIPWENVQPRPRFGLGISGEVWRNETINRKSGVIYTNAHPYPIVVSVCLSRAIKEVSLKLWVNGVLLHDKKGVALPDRYNNLLATVSVLALIPPKSTYKVEGYYPDTWYELY